MADDAGETVTSISTAIRRYLEERPHAADSLGGVRSWWVPAAARADPKMVEQALAVLVAEGVVRRRILPDSTVIYSKSGVVGG